jgi:hypothetical protein
MTAAVETRKVLRTSKMLCGPVIEPDRTTMPMVFPGMMKCETRLGTHETTPVWRIAECRVSATIAISWPASADANSE